MGENLISFCKKYIKKQWKIAFIAAFSACLLVHIYKFTNTLPNHDSLFNIYVDQNMTASGRWFLQFACGISSYFELPWLNGLLCAVYLGVAAVVITALFDLKNPVVIVISGLLLVTCPSTTETLFFGFTADGYFLGLMLSAFAAYFSCRASCLRHFIISGMCICFSCAIYQAYLSVGVVLCICFLIIELLEYRLDIRGAWAWIRKHIVLYVVSVSAYYVVWKCILFVTGQAPNNYQGINTVGQISLSNFVHGAVSSVVNLFFFFLEWNILEHPITLYAVLNIFLLAGFVYILIVSVINSKIYYNRATLSLILLAVFLCVPVISIWSFVSNDVQYHPMMMHSAVVLYIFAVILFDRWATTKISTAFGMVIAVMIFNFAVMANISYFYQDKCYEKSYYMGTRLMERIEDARQEDASITQIAFVGNRIHDVSIEQESPGDRIHILSSRLEKDFLYDHMHSYLFLKNTFGLTLNQATTEQIDKLESTQVVRTMDNWPASASVKVIDGILVIKLEDIS